MQRDLDMDSLYADIVTLLRHYGLDAYDLVMSLGIRRSDYESIKFKGKTIQRIDQSPMALTSSLHNDHTPIMSIQVAVKQIIDPKTHTLIDYDW